MSKSPTDQPPSDRVASPTPDDGARLSRLSDVFAALAQVGDTPAPKAAAPASADGAEVLDVWRLVRHLGSGGMGDVYLAERCDGRVEQQVAIKRVRDARPAAVERLGRELRILARLAHPNIARFLDAGLDARGMPYMVMEYVAGETIDAYCAARRLPLADRLRLLMAVCEAVDHAHRHLVVHRDLKPANVLVDEQGTPKLLDFGIAKLLEDSGPATYTANVVMTLVYAAPEQLLGDAVSTATDVYALGLLAHLLLTGELPLARQAETASEMIARAPFDEPPAPSTRLAAREARGERWPVSARELRGDLDAVLLTALAPEPARRYASAAALREELRNVLEARPVRVRAHSTWYRTRRFITRHRWGVAASLAVIASILGGLGVSLWQAREARAQAARAEIELARAEAVKGFVADMFSAADPYGAAQHEVQLSTVLEAAEQRLGTELRAQPAVQAELAEILGNAYVSLIDHARARRMLELALTSDQASPTPSPRRQARVRARLAFMDLTQDGKAEALATLEQVTAQLRALGPEARPDLSRALSLLADAHWQREQVDSALHDIAENLDLVGTISGHDSAEYWDALASQAEYLRIAGRHEEAAQQARMAAEGLERTHGPDKLSTLIARRVQANALADAGKAREALPLLDDLVERFGKVLSKTHTYYQGTRFVQADALWSLGYLDRAATAYRELAVSDDAETQRNAVTIHQRIGAVELARERYAEALPELQIALDFFRQATGPESTPTILIATARVEALLGLHRFDEARAELATLDLPAKENDLRTATRWRLAAARLARHDRDEARARELIDESLARLRKDGKEDAREAIGTWIALGELERDQGHVEAALAALTHARQLLDTQLATPTPQSRQVDEALKALASKPAKG